MMIFKHLIKVIEGKYTCSYVRLGESENRERERERERERNLNFLSFPGGISRNMVWN